MGDEPTLLPLRSKGGPMTDRELVAALEAIEGRLKFAAEHKCAEIPVMADWLKATAESARALITRLEAEPEPLVTCTICGRAAGGPMVAPVPIVSHAACREVAAKLREAEPEPAVLAEGQKQHLSPSTNRGATLTNMTPEEALDYLVHRVLVYSTRAPEAEAVLRRALLRGKVLAEGTVAYHDRPVEIGCRVLIVPAESQEQS